MIDPELRTYLDRLEAALALLPHDVSPAERRALRERLAAETAAKLPPGIAAHDETVPGEARPVRVRMFRPHGGEVLPCLIYMHGGGFFQGSPETHAHITAAIAERSGFCVISCDYALAPEHTFPAAHDDCAAVVRWVFANSDRLRIRSDAIAVGGDSAGANIAASLALLFRETPERLLAQMLFYPGVDFAHDRPSMRENADAPVLTAALIRKIIPYYLPNEADRLNPLASPYLAADHRGLPPAYIAVAEHDPLRDDGFAYAAKLRASGVHVTFHEGKGLCHSYLRAILEVPSAREPLDQACDWLSKPG